jgi:hypothetical protein
MINKKYDLIENNYEIDIKILIFIFEGPLIFCNGIRKRRRFDVSNSKVQKV